MFSRRRPGIDASAAAAEGAPYYERRTSSLACYIPLARQLSLSCGSRRQFGREKRLRATQPSRAKMHSGNLLHLIPPFATPVPSEIFNSYPPFSFLFLDQKDTDTDTDSPIRRMAHGPKEGHHWGVNIHPMFDVRRGVHFISTFCFSCSCSVSREREELPLSGDAFCFHLKRTRTAADTYPTWLRRPVGCIASTSRGAFRAVSDAMPTNV